MKAINWGTIMDIINDKINILKAELDKSIEENKSFDEIYSISKQLDSLIVEYYKRD